jgi:hypothetical protein
MSLYKKKSTFALATVSLDLLGNFSIMAANKIFELPEKSRV